MNPLSLRVQASRLINILVAPVETSIFCSDQHLCPTGYLQPLMAADLSALVHLVVLHRVPPSLLLKSGGVF